MEQETLFEISRQSRQAVEELLNAANLRAGDIFVIGCSSSEIVGGHIGKDSSMEAAKAVLDGVLPALKARGIYLAAQCCEHLNRAIVLERAAAEQYGYEQVNAVPQPHAGGSWATNCWRHADRHAPAPGGGAGAAEFGPHRQSAYPVRPLPAQVHRRRARRLPEILRCI